MGFPVLRPDRIPNRWPGVVFRLHAEMVVGNARFTVISDLAAVLRSDVGSQSRWMPTWPAALM